MKRRKYVRPTCHQKTGVEIVYGMPSRDAGEKAARGEIALGGCCIDREGQERKCRNCGHEWRIKRKEVRIG